MIYDIMILIIIRTRSTFFYVLLASFKRSNTQGKSVANQRSTSSLIEGSFIPYDDDFKTLSIKNVTTSESTFP